MAAKASSDSTSPRDFSGRPGPKRGGNITRKRFNLLPTSSLENYSAVTRNGDISSVQFVHSSIDGVLLLAAAAAAIATFILVCVSFHFSFSARRRWLLLFLVVAFSSKLDGTLVSLRNDL